VVKAFNTMVWTQLGADGRPAGDRDRLLHFVAGDDAAAKEIVRGLADDIGFDTIDHGGLAAGRAQQPGSAVFGVPLTFAQASGAS
jgi:predicted dinucleotide-binding enzyme